eukprot:GDKI01046839.1.p1 GENE.GDKI01046839.1~~GDKI01046839.1.p1  ORF type:complete len:248 (+),score=45.34 GDKI01046839.1:303-1046(+)
MMGDCDDAIMANINCTGTDCTDTDLVSIRSDWSATGAYGGLAGAAVDAVVGLEGGFGAALTVLKNISMVTHPTHGTMPAPGIATMTLPYMLAWLNNNNGIPPPTYAFASNFPEFFDKGEQKTGFPPVWPATSRSIQNAEGSIADAFIRSVFGWRPDWASLHMFRLHGDVTAAINASLYLPNTGRADFTGTLYNLRTPFNGALIDITAGDNGLTWQFSAAPASSEGPVPGRLDAHMTTPAASVPILYE